MIEGVTREFNFTYQDPDRTGNELAAELFLNGMDMTFGQHHAEDSDELHLTLPYAAGRAAIQLMRRKQLIKIDLPPTSDYDAQTHTYARHSPPHTAVHRIDNVPSPTVSATLPARRYPSQMRAFLRQQYPDNPAHYLAALDYIVSGGTANLYRAGRNNRPVDPEEVRDLFMWLSEARL